MSGLEDELVASDEDAYYRLALRLINVDTYRQKVKTQISEVS